MNSQTLVLDSNYKYYLEKKLVDEFRKKFYDKLGYYPRVLLYDDIKVPVMELSNLKQLVEEVMWENHPELKDVPITDSRRLEELVRFRKIFFFLGKSMGYTLKTLGNFMGDRDHSTVIHNITSAKNFLRNGNRAFVSSYSQVFQSLSKIPQN